MDLSTSYLGLPLRSPLVVGSCGPLSKNIGDLRQMEDAGAGAVVLHSLFEEQLLEEQLHKDRAELDYYLNQGVESHAEALSYVPSPVRYFTLDPPPTWSTFAQRRRWSIFLSSPAQTAQPTAAGLTMPSKSKRPVPMPWN